MATTGGDSPLGSDKGQIYGGLTKIIFTDHPKYGAAYSSNSKKFHDAVGSHITTQVLFLRKKYKKVKASFGSTGTGVMPTEGSQAKNLLDAALLELLWYKDLDTIWHSNPSMARTTHSLKLGVDHAGALYSLVQSNSGATIASPQHSAITSPQHSAIVSPQHSAIASPQHSAITSPKLIISCTPAPHPPPVPPNMNILAGGQYPPVVLQQPPPAPSYPPPEVHLPGLSSDDDEAENNFSFDRRLGDPAEDDNMMLEDDKMILDDASPIAGKKCQLPSTSSPPPNVPELFEGAEALKLWELMQTAVGDVVQRVDTIIDDAQLVVRLPHVPDVLVLRASFLLSADGHGSCAYIGP
ncbi:uncharacterized protein F5891DRAFT_1190809 [Suillus fuscotomentosus]|uniref:Uncharacterized protein n=1 Tax=Suillus fuscotomentosus TaxID=1912939 RepID=A0AAD4HJ20_9AGAM|nr:uncharacterized protein F5891DRAFT_1190809 [Suillus fuscotomentosus]KAG1898423.1 hypothetical protein F5891DRAFT_1190809 [Suillus fuscotomentosus]